MSIHRITGRFLSYNLWANERLTSWLATLDRSILYKETGSSFGTIDRTLQHLLAAEFYWIDLIFSGRINDFERPLRENVVEEVMNDLVVSSKNFVDSTAALSDPQLTDIIKASDSTQGRYEYILHMVNHASYHRGQIVSMARILGVKGEIPVTDYDAYLWWVENRQD